MAFSHRDLPFTWGGPLWRSDEHEVERWCRLLCESGIPAETRRLEVVPPERSLPRWLDGATVVHPGAASAARRWPVERFAAVARSERRRGREVVVTAGPGERPLADDLAERARLSGDRVLSRIDLLDLLAVISRAGRVVSGDTGVAHVATAVGTPSVVLFGPVPPALWGPPRGRPWHRALWAGRIGDPHGERLDPGLDRISVEQVIGALDGLGHIRDRRAVGARP